MVRAAIIYTGGFVTSSFRASAIQMVSNTRVGAASSKGFAKKTGDE